MPEHSSQKPLAEVLRPQYLDEVIGHTKLLDKGGFLRAIIEKKQPVSLILWGPPGSGKTTLARIIARTSGYNFVEISAVASGIAEVKKVVAAAEDYKRLGQGTVLFVDEIHRFNKAQQDAFLPHVENGSIILIGATTENPSFEVIGPLLSRSRVVVLDKLEDEQVKLILKKAVQELKGLKIEPKALDALSQAAGGDARRALNALEVAQTLSDGKITTKIIEQALQQNMQRYDRNGEYHYDTISAFIKSLRGSNVDASLYYLLRMIKGGEDPKFIARRMVIFASEDVGLASHAALNLAVSNFLAVERIGLPEAEYALVQTAIALARAPKSRAVADALAKAKSLVEQFGDLNVPLHLRNAPTGLMKELGYGNEYQWQANFQHKHGFLPPEMEGIEIFQSDTDAKE
jgi:putative ATPase